MVLLKHNRIFPKNLKLHVGTQSWPQNYIQSIILYSSDYNKLWKTYQPVSHLKNEIVYQNYISYIWKE